MLLILNERLSTTVLFKMNNESLDLYEYEAENRDLNDYLLIRSLFTKITLNENCERLCSCSSTRIKIIFTIGFIISDDRLIINLLSRLIVIFNLFRDERDDFEFKKKFFIKTSIEIILKKKSAQKYKE